MAEEEEVRLTGREEKKKGGDRRHPPLFENRDNGVTVWADRDRNDNVYLRVRLPLGLGSVPVFVNDNSYEDLQRELNQLVERNQED